MPTQASIKQALIPLLLSPDWVKARVLELTYTAWDLEAFAQDCGWSGPPFRWDEERRFLIRSELDAAFFHLYLGPETEWRQQPAALTQAFAVLLLVLDLLWRGYRVCLSSHSPQVLDILWALRVFREKGGTAEDVLDLFSCKATPSMTKVAEAVLKKTGKVHYFRQDGRTSDISKLDPGAEDMAEAGWGGLSEFSGRAGDVVSRVVSRAQQEVLL